MPRPLLVLDLDETLIHCSKKDFYGSQTVLGGYYMAIRDGLDDFLQRISDHYDLMIWSNGGEDYVNLMVEAIWPSDIPLVAIYSAKQCGLEIKDGKGEPMFKEVSKLVKRMPQYTKERVLALDDTPHKHKHNFGNLVRISPFEGLPDRELELAANYLISISTCENFRGLEKRWWQTQARKNLLIPSDHNTSYM